MPPTALAAALLLLATRALAQDDRAHTRSERLRAVVNAWLSADAKEATAGSLQTPPFSQAETDMITQLATSGRSSFTPHKTLQELIPNNRYTGRPEPGPAVLEYGSCLGEATVALAAAVAFSKTKVFALDSFDDPSWLDGNFMQPRTWSPEETLKPWSLWSNAAASLPNPVAFYRFLAKVQAAQQQDRIVPLPLLNASTLARAHGFGASNRPSLIYVNPLVNSTNLRHDLAALWRLLACGGTMAGLGYHRLWIEVDAFAEGLKKHASAAEKSAAELETFTVHAPGSRWESLDQFTAEVMAKTKQSEMSLWRLKAKPCI